MLTVIIDDSTFTLVAAVLSALSTILGILFGKAHIDKTKAEGKLDAVNTLAATITPTAKKLMDNQPVTPDEIKAIALGFIHIFGGS